MNRTMPAASIVGTALLLLAGVSALRHALAWAIETQLVLDFGDGALSHADLLRRHQLWLRRFPKHPGRKSVAARTDQLKHIVAAKRKHAASRNTNA